MSADDPLQGDVPINDKNLKSEIETRDTHRDISLSVERSTIRISRVRLKHPESDRALHVENTINDKNLKSEIETRFESFR